jgi:hypothetical protein
VGELLGRDGLALGWGEFKQGRRSLTVHVHRFNPLCGLLGLEAFGVDFFHDRFVSMGCKKWL